MQHIRISMYLYIRQGRRDRDDMVSVYTCMSTYAISSIHY